MDGPLVCCGGGGLLAGTALALSKLAKSSVRIFGVEPVNACGMYKSLQVSTAIYITIFDKHFF